MCLSLRLDLEVETFGLLLLCPSCGSIPLLVPYGLPEPDDVPSPSCNKRVSFACCRKRLEQTSFTCLSLGDSGDEAIKNPHSH